MFRGELALAAIQERPQASQAHVWRKGIIIHSFILSYKRHGEPERDRSADAVLGYTRTRWEYERFIRRCVGNKITLI